MMQTIKRLAPLCLATLCLAGCTTTLTNLTPTSLPRNPAGQYNLEAAWKTSEQAIRENTVKASVMIGQDFYPLDRVARLTNRWEGLIPVPADKNEVFYRFKFDYDIAKIPAHVPGSKLSKEYKLTIKDK